MYTAEQVSVEGSPMDLLVFMPQGAGRFPGMVVAQHLPVAHAGLETDPFTIDVGEKFAAAGYACIIPHVFHWWPKDEEMAVKRDAFRDDRAVADMDAAFSRLAGMDAVDGDRIGIIGHCWGGRLALLGASHNARYKAAATLYGGRLKVGLGPGSPPIMDLVARVRCPILGIYGNDDANPSPEDVDDLDAALNDAGVVHSFHRYDGAGHAFQDFTNPERHRPGATEDSWAKVWAFFETHLKG